MRICKLMTRSFKKLDIFGKPIRLYLNQKTMHKTIFGGLLSIAIIITVLILSINNFISLFDRSGLYVEQTQDFEIMPSRLVMPKNDFVFSLSMQDTTVRFNNSIFSFDVNYTTYTRDSKGNITKLKVPMNMKICELSDFQGFEKEFTEYNLNIALCPNQSQIDVAGDFISQTYKFIEISIYSCTNGSNPLITCASPDTITKYFNNNKKIRIQLFFKNYLINSLDYKNPIIPFIDQMAWIISPNTFSISTELYFRSLNIKTMDNLFGYGNPSEINGFRYPNEKTDQIYAGDPKNYLSIYLRKSSYLETYHRRYKTIGEIFAIIGGFWNFLFLGVGLIVHRFNNVKYNWKLANSLYDFEDIDDNNDNKIKQLSLPSSLTLGLEENGKTYNKKKIPFNTIEIFMKFFYSKTQKVKKKEKLIKRAMNEIMLEVDIVVIMKKLHEMEKLKQILLTPEQKNLLNSMPPRLIKLNEMDEIMKSPKNCKAKLPTLNDNNNKGSTTEHGFFSERLSEMRYIKVNNENNRRNGSMSPAFEVKPNDISPIHTKNSSTCNQASFTPLNYENKPSDFEFYITNTNIQTESKEFKDNNFTKQPKTNQDTILKDQWVTFSKSEEDLQDKKIDMSDDMKVKQAPNHHPKADEIKIDEIGNIKKNKLVFFPILKQQTIARDKDIKLHDIDDDILEEEC